MIRAIYNEGHSPVEQFAQRFFMEQSYPGCIVRKEGMTLVVDFGIEDPDYATKYRLRIWYRSQREHKLFIIKPKIAPSPAIHMYSDGSLCLYYPPDISPLRRLWIHKDLMPMAALWVCHYEQWLVNGHIWKGREAPGHQQLLERLGIVN